MPNRTYADLSSEIDILKSYYSSFARRYESIQESLTSDDVEPQLKEAIMAGIWNAKGWYGLNVYTENFDSPMSGYVWNNLTNQVNSVYTQLAEFNNKIQQVYTILQEAVEQNSDSPCSAGFWGYAMGFAEWNDEIYEHLRLIDEIYGDTQEKSGNTHLALNELHEFNNSVTQILDRVGGFELPHYLDFTKVNQGIDYNKIIVSLTQIVKNGNTIGVGDPISVGEIYNINNLTGIELPELEEGQYLLKLENKYKIKIVNWEPIDEWSIRVRVTNWANFTGWYIDNQHPIIDSNYEGDFTYVLKTGSLPEQDWMDKFIHERYIEPISIILNVEKDKTDLIYDFFYGNYIDEFIDELDNGNKIYYRTIKDTDNNPIAIYQMELDYNTTYNGGMPIINYTRLDQ